MVLRHPPGIRLSTSTIRLIPLGPARSTGTCLAGRLESAPHRPAHSAAHRLAFPVKLVHKIRWQSDDYMFHSRHRCIVPHCHTKSNRLCHGVPYLNPFFLGCEFAEKESQTLGR